MDNNEIVYLYLDDIIPNRFQPREIFNEQALKELAVSIKEHGVIQPIIVRQVENKYEIIAGERRYKASTMAGLTKIPAIVKNLDDKESSKIALIENLQRKDLTPIEEARTYQKILELENGMTQEALAATLGKTQSAVSNKIRLLALPDEVQDALLNEKISERHARTLLSIDDKNVQVKVLDRIINEKLSVRDLERILKEDSNDSDNSGVSENKEVTNDVIEEKQEVNEENKEGDSNMDVNNIFMDNGAPSGGGQLPINMPIAPGESADAQTLQDRMANATIFGSSTGMPITSDVLQTNAGFGGFQNNQMNNGMMNSNPMGGMQQNSFGMQPSNAFGPTTVDINQLRANAMDINQQPQQQASFDDLMKTNQPPQNANKFLSDFGGQPADNGFGMQNNQSNPSVMDGFSVNNNSMVNNTLNSLLGNNARFSNDPIQPQQNQSFDSMFGNSNNISSGMGNSIMNFSQPQKKDGMEAVTELKNAVSGLIVRGYKVQLQENDIGDSYQMVINVIK